MVPGRFSWLFMVPGWFFMVPGGFSWLFMVPGWFTWFQVGFLWIFMVLGLFFMVFLQNLPAKTVSWPHNPV